MARPARRPGGARYGRARGAEKKPEKEVQIVGSLNAVRSHVWRRAGAGTPLNQRTGSPASRGERLGTSRVPTALCRRARAARGMGRKTHTEGTVQCPSVSLEKTVGRLERRVPQGAPTRRWRLPVFAGFWGFFTGRLGRPGARAGHRLLAGHSGTALNGACVPVAAIATRRNAARGCPGVGPSWCCGFDYRARRRPARVCLARSPRAGDETAGVAIWGFGATDAHDWPEKRRWLRARLATWGRGEGAHQPATARACVSRLPQHGVVRPTGLRRRPCHECHILRHSHTMCSVVQPSPSISSAPASHPTF